MWMIALRTGHCCRGVESTAGSAATGGRRCDRALRRLRSLPAPCLCSDKGCRNVHGRVVACEGELPSRSIHAAILALERWCACKVIMARAIGGSICARRRVVNGAGANCRCYADVKCLRWGLQPCGTPLGRGAASTPLYVCLRMKRPFVPYSHYRLGRQPKQRADSPPH